MQSIVIRLSALINVTRIFSSFFYDGEMKNKMKDEIDVNVGVDVNIDVNAVKDAVKATTITI